MNPLTHLKQTILPFLVAIVLVCLALLPRIQAAPQVAPAPDGCYPAFTTAEGCHALSGLAAGEGNTGIGWYSLSSVAGGNFNTGVGAGTLALNTADSNTAVGTAAMLLNSTGTENTAIGTATLVHNGIASSNCAVGSFALYDNDSSGHGTATFNTAVGSNALEFNVDGAANTAVGLAALSANQASGLTAVGADALFANIIATANTAVGDLALANNDSTGHGVGNNNTAVGSGALQKNIDATGNTAVGAAALFFNDSTGHGAAAFNTAVGSGALANNTDGLGNAVVGASAGQNIVTGTFNVYLGAFVGLMLPDESNTVRINDDVNGFTGSRCFIGGITGNGPFGSAVSIDPATGQLGVTVSSARFKRDIAPMGKSSETILSFKPVTFHYKNDQTNTPQWGLIAEDVAKVDPGLVALDKEGKIYSVRYEAVNAMLLNEFLKEHRKVHEQEATISQLQSTVAKQEVNAARQQKQIDSLTSGLQKVRAQLELSKPAPQTVLNNQ